MADKTFTIDHVGLLLYKLKEIQYQAKDFGITLGLKYNADIQAVCRQSHEAPHECLQKVFSLWLQQPSQQRTWEILVKALRRDGEHVIANTIERKYTPLDQPVSVEINYLLGLVDGINTTNWRSVGLNLGLTLSQINEIDDKGGWSQYVMIQLLSLWLRGSGKPATLGTLVTAVRELQNFDLAERLEEDSELHLSDSAPIIQDDIPKDVTDGVTQQTSNDTSKNSVITDNQPLAVTATKTDACVSKVSMITNIPPLTDAVCHVFYKPTMIKNKWIVIIAVIKPHLLENMIRQFGDCIPGQKLKTILIESTITLQLPDSQSSTWSVEYPTPTELLQADVLLGKICCFEMTVSSEFIVPLPLQMAVILKGAQPPNNIVTIERFAEVVLTPKVLERWIVEGFVDLHITKLNIHGAPKTGKTSSLHLLLGEPPPPKYNSTDIARAAISVETAEQWVRADHIKTIEKCVQMTDLKQALCRFSITNNSIYHCTVGNVKRKFYHCPIFFK